MYIPAGSLTFEGENNHAASSGAGTIADPLVPLVGLSGSAALASQGYTSSVTITRPNDTAAYAANDVIGAATGSTAAVEFTNVGPSGGNIFITSAEFEVRAAALISGETSYRLHLYSVTPPSALGDNAAHDLPSGDRASYLGYISLGTPVDLGSTLYVGTDGINKHIKLAGTSLFGYLVTIGAFTPAAETVRKVTLHTVAI
jgi:hypothetical protein